MGKKQDKKNNKQAGSQADKKTSSLAYLQVLGLGTDVPDGIVPSIYLFLDQCRMIFNVGEGLQRYCVQHQVKLSKVEDIFLTRITTQTTGGLPVRLCPGHSAECMLVCISSLNTQSLMSTCLSKF